MITLAIDTSTPRGSVAVFAYGDLVFDESFTAGRNHSAALFASLERARACTSHIHQVAVGLGPGSYAGVRIAIAAALAFDLALGAKLVGLPSVAALETDAPEYLAIGDARRNSFYFTHVVERTCADGPRLLDEHALRELLETFPSQPCYADEPLAAFPSAQISRPSAVFLARLASEGKSIIATGDLEPIYLREPHITQPATRLV
jgi:tRNA threonylcarbamoyladenosine biosynthesis protein TsaB